ncbi:MULTISPECIES: molybdopterin-dependent oxidoreductase [unclassified Thioalkalivibrio]|uniref:molybdopterin-dependent oxidoreductase n=1 Tax=unclassified Thioalkalivibrio TaxID=2621013 RepID=UPI00036AD963|nr:MULTISPECIES: molybdopterin-dependent oxidoreductase [unclassified Thioalkalivibrio]
MLAALLALPGTASGTNPDAPGNGFDPKAEPTGEVILRVEGKIRHTNDGDRSVLDRAMLDRLPQREMNTSTVVTDGVNRFEGFLLRDLLEALGAEGEEVVATALNDYIVEIPMEDFHEYDVIVAHTQDGEPLTPRDKGPLWIVYPRDDHTELDDIRYDYRWVWQLAHVEVR